MLVTEPIVIKGICGCIIEMRMKYEARMMMARRVLSKECKYEAWKEVICSAHKEELQAKMVIALREEFPC